MKSVNSPVISKQIELWTLDRLIPYARNARTHSETQIAHIAGSIVEFGFTNPILVDSSGGIIAGHARLLAARKLNLEHVPVIVIDYLTDTQKRAYVIADNKLALNAGWDPELLRLELLALEQESFNRDPIGISDKEFEEEFKDLLAELERETGNTDEDAAPDVPETPVTVAGDLWILGNHRLLCGDATGMDSLMQVLAGEQADLVFTDPPYNVAYSQSRKEQGRSRPIANDNLGREFGKFLYDVCVNLLTVSKGAVYIFMSSSELHTLQKAFIDAGGHWSTFVVWAKDHFTLGRSDYHRQYEIMLYGWRQGGNHYWNGARNQGDVWQVNKPRVNDLHPTMKPVELIEHAIGNSSQSRDVVLDPFGGAGSTLIACEKTGRRARLIEIEPNYVDVSIQRWQEFTGRQATLASDGRTFADIAGERLQAKALTTDVDPKIGESDE
jgi:DNA modification methylase